jgi:hypothetical protein
MKPKILAALIYLGAGVTCGLAFEPLWRHGLAVPYVESLATGFIVPAIFLCASVGVFRNPRLTYLVGMIAAFLVWPYVVRNEFAFYHFSNSWIAFNSPFITSSWSFVIKDIIAIVFLLLATTCSILRLCPATWSIRSLPVRDRTWPVFAASFLSVVIWFVTAVVPYRVPISDRNSALGRYVFLLHVEKKGIHFQETKVGVSPSQFRFSIERDDRSLFHYEFDDVMSRGNLPQDRSITLAKLFESPEFKSLRSASRTSLSWNSDRWFLFSTTARGPVLRGVDKAEIPKALLDWFYEVESLPTYETMHFVQRDVCLGFCYDPTY